MSMQIVMICRCDGCGVELACAEPTASGVNEARWAINRHLEKTGGMRQEVYSRPTRHYCAECADRPKP